MKLYEKMNKTQKEKRNWVSESESKKEKDLIFEVDHNINNNRSKSPMWKRGLIVKRVFLPLFLSLKYSMILSLYYVCIYILWLLLCVLLQLQCCDCYERGEDG